jgi:hypothetical protein
MDMSFTTEPGTLRRILEVQARMIVVLAWWGALVAGGVGLLRHFGPVWAAGLGYYAALAVMMDCVAPDNVGLWSE